MPLVLMLLLLLAVPSVLAADSPNVILLVADDLGWGDVGYHGGVARTPNIDELASKGLMLERFYAFPMCSPTRAALMTGRSPVELGVDGPIAPASEEGLPLDEHLLPQSFRSAGYQAYMAGKWHLGLGHVDYFPHSRGFDHFYGFLGPGIDYFTHINRGGLDWQRDGKSVREEGYSTELLTQEAVELLRRRDKSKPTLLYVAYNAVHNPLQAPERYTDHYAGLDPPRRRIYAGMVEAMDTGIGKILTALEDEGMIDNTIVVFLSDNGATPTGSNEPLRGVKGQTFEGGIRVPAILWWPGVIEGGGKSEQYVTSHDWFPTLAAAAGVEPGVTKPFYGQNLWPALRDGNVLPHKEFIIMCRGNLAYFQDGWKLVRSVESANQTERETMLFHIDEDPSEENNLAAEHPEIVTEIMAKVEAFPKGHSVTGPPQNGDEGRARRRPRPGQRPGEAGAGPAGRRPGGRRPAGGRPAAQGETEETREPYAEAAKRN